MIVRVLGEGQLEVPDHFAAELYQLDAVLEAAVADDDEVAFTRALADLVGRVQAVGTPLPDHMVLPSEAILPPPESTIAQVRVLLGDDGLIPG